MTFRVRERDEKSREEPEQFTENEGGRWMIYEKKLKSWKLRKKTNILKELYNPVTVERNLEIYFF